MPKILLWWGNSRALPKTGSALSVYGHYGCKTLRRAGPSANLKKIGQLANLPVLLLTTRGRESGLRRTVPLCYLPVPSSDGRDPRFAIVGSYGGSPVAPAWYKNLQATSVAEIEVKGQRFSVLSRDAEPEQAAQLWQDFVECYPGYEVYQAATTRKIPIVLLELY